MNKFERFHPSENGLITSDIFVAVFILEISMQRNRSTGENAIKRPITILLMLFIMNDLRPL